MLSCRLIDAAFAFRRALRCRHCHAMLHAALRFFFRLMLCRHATLRFRFSFRYADEAMPLFHMPRCCYYADVCHIFAITLRCFSLYTP